MMDFYTSALTGTILSAALGTYHHAIYPAAIAIVGRKKPVAPISERDLPHLEILMPAYNEAEFIARKIAAIAAADYPNEKLSIQIACDGCSDQTFSESLAAQRRYPTLDITVLNHRTNRGKLAVLNELIAGSHSDILVLSDVSALPRPDAFKKLSAWFQDPAVGAVGGGYELPADSGTSQRLYWRYQAAIKAGESRIAGLIGAHGALYAVRRNAVSQLPADTINDDFVLPVQIACDGWKTLYDPTIQVLEGENDTQRCDMARRRRIGAGNFQQALRWLGPTLRSGGIGLPLCFLSGKVLRCLMGPLLVVGILCLAILSLFQPLWSILLGLVALGSILPGPGRYAVTGHLNAMAGAFGYVCGRYRRWHRVSRDPHNVSQSTSNRTLEVSDVQTH